MRDPWRPLMRTAGCLGPLVPASAGWLVDHGLIDPKDGMLDASDYLSSAHGFLPVPIFITEPAIGTGLGLAATHPYPVTPLIGVADHLLPVNAAARLTSESDFIGRGARTLGRDRR